MEGLATGFRANQKCLLVLEFEELGWFEVEWCQLQSKQLASFKACVV